MELPKYVSLNGTELRLKDNEYWRDAGLWGVGYKIVDGKLFSCWIEEDAIIHNKELIPITEEEWRKGNGKYINEI